MSTEIFVVNLFFTAIMLGYAIFACFMFNQFWYMHSWYSGWRKALSIASDLAWCTIIVCATMTLVVLMWTAAAKEEPLVRIQRPSCIESTQ